jgi:PleD family two-component response regulator
MATDKLFTVAGISKREGEYKVRFANDVMRVKVLMKGGHEDVRLVELDQPSTKMEAVEVLRTMAEFSDVIAQATIADFIEANTPRQPKAKTVKSAKAPKAVKPESTPTATKAPVEKISAKSAYDSVKDTEDAPY